MNRRVKIGRLVLLAIVMTAGTGVVLMRAQQTNPEQQQKNSENGPERQRGIGGELAHEENEAAGETDAFKHSPSVQFVSRITGLSLKYSYWLCYLLNFIFVAWAIIWAGYRYVPRMFRDRTTAIQRAMREAQKASEEARRKLAEIEARLQKLDVEIGMMRDAAEKESAAEEARIKAAAESDARKIIAGAEQEIAAAAKAARRQLTAHAADLAVGLAQKQIRIDPGTDQALVRTFASELSSASNHSGKDGN